MRKTNHELGNFVMAPHVAGNVAEAMTMTTRWVTVNIRRYLRGEPVESVVIGGRLPVAMWGERGK